MASKICIQSSVNVHPQSGFNNWQNLLRSQLKPKLVLRKQTPGEFQFVIDHLAIFVELFDEPTLIKMYESDTDEVHYINMGLNQMQVHIWCNYIEDEDIKPHGRVVFDASIVRLDRNGDASQITNVFHSLRKKLYNV